jgi:threonine-phosphate decarboxylase
VAGVAALAQDGYLERSRAFVDGQRAWLVRELAALGLPAIPSCANYLLFRCDVALHGPLLERGVLVRCCGDFAGLDARWYRVAVRTVAQNRRLVEALKEVLA